MEANIEELNEEIELLSKRIEILEKRENRRRAFFYTKLIIKIVLIVVILFGAYQGYQYVVKEMPTMMEEKIKELGLGIIKPSNK